MSKLYFRGEHPNDDDRIPVIVDVPHAGEWVPEVLSGEITPETADMKRDLDLYVDRLWVDAPALGAMLIVSEVSRYVVDLNRARNDVSPNTVRGAARSFDPGYYHDRGVVWRTSTDGTPVMTAPLAPDAFERRIANFWAPYHDAISERIASLREEFGFCILVDGHSMPSVGRTDHLSRPARRADIVPGDLDGKTCDPALTRTVVSHFRGEGYSVLANQPYKGGWITRNYGRPDDGVHAIQIEVNRGLYMDERTFDVRAEGLERMRRACAALLPRLAQLNFRRP